VNEGIMERLIAELNRLYLPRGAVAPETLARHLLGQEHTPVPLAADDGRIRALAVPFERSKDDGEDGHWQRLCAVANALQSDLGLPAPAVSVTGENGYRLWLSFAEPVPAGAARRLLEGLHRARLPEADLEAALAAAPVALPPCLHPRTGRWAAFIHPGMGASFADEPGLELPPPLAGQVAFLEGLESIGADQLRHALDVLARSPDTEEEPAQPGPRPAAPVPARNDGLLLKDATLEDIVAFLHARNIEPTFRFLK
jgi:hypothetical protein